LDPEDVGSLSLGAVWNLVKERGSYNLDIRLQGTKDLSKRPMCIRVRRAETLDHFEDILLDDGPGFFWSDPVFFM
jgi:hypothetical protein